jgi:hypothetical protein
LPIDGVIGRLPFISGEIYFNTSGCEKLKPGGPFKSAIFELSGKNFPASADYSSFTLSFLC